MKRLTQTFIALLTLAIFPFAATAQLSASLKPNSLHLSTSTTTYIKPATCSKKADIHIDQLEAFYFPAPVFLDMMRNEIQYKPNTPSAHAQPVVIAHNNLTYTATLEDGSPLPAWIEYMPKDHIFFGMPTSIEAGTYKVLLTASNGAQTEKALIKIHVHTPPGL